MGSVGAARPTSDPTKPGDCVQQGAPSLNMTEIFCQELFSVVGLLDLVGQIWDQNDGLCRADTIEPGDCVQQAHLL